ncbi:hypothetical protein N1027_06205 [Herbiconiux sp. CPCC 205763]|uniref:Integral membrane bound transporter domain-containing protein n=1 Tax=Herbiconiux aconitum TaxID=2970913 RepID=A0ABT2GNC9_9MICO|nr:FUSC family protein [Herbiconiux aconitum]MCS5717725.1 hypothetical protein [Herbiconiux aconitum]
MTDSPRVWTAEALSAALRFQALASLPFRDGADAGAWASLLARRDRVARALTEKRFASQPISASEASIGESDSSHIAELSGELDRIEAANLRRDNTRIRLPRKVTQTLLFGGTRSLLSWESAALRHALRVTVGISVALPLAALLPYPSLHLALLAVSWGTLQPAFHDTVARIIQRVVGVLLGAGVTILLAAIVPTPVLLSVGGAAIVLGSAFIFTRRWIFYACSLILSVGAGAATLRTDTAEYAAQYLVAVGLGLGIGVVFGSVVVPWQRRRTATDSLEAAIAATRELIRAELDTRAAPREDALRRVMPFFRRALAASQQLRQYGLMRPVPTAEQMRALDDAHGAVSTVVIVTAYSFTRPQELSRMAAVMVRENSARLREALQTIRGR